METFKDNEGKKWSLSLTHRKVRQMAEVMGLDLLRPQHQIQVLDSLTDRLSFVWLLVKEEAVKDGLDEDSFEKRLHGVGYAFKASKAFLMELESFSQRLGQEGPAQMIRECLLAMDQAYAKQKTLLSEQAISGQ